MSDGFFYSTKHPQFHQRNYIYKWRNVMLELYERIYLFMEISLIPKQRLVLVRVSGEIDHHTSEEIRRASEKEIRRSGAINIAFDFGRVSFMDSSGIGMIIGRYKTVSALGGHLIIYDASGQIKRLIEMSGLSQLIIVSDTLQKGINEKNRLKGVKI